MWSLSGDLGKISKAKIIKTIECAIENNFLEFDTAPTYGNGRIDNLLSKITKGVKGVKINTKCGYNSDLIKTFCSADIERSLENSLKKFDTINTLFLHNPRNEILSWSKILKLLNKFKKYNLVKNIGISLARNYYFSDKIMNSFDYLQDEINILRPNNIDILKNLKPKILARSPLASGCLSGRLSVFSKFQANDYRKNWLGDKVRLKNIIFQINELKKIFGEDIKNFAKCFLLQDKNISQIIFGVKKPLHINELVFDLNNFKRIPKKKICLLKKLAIKNFNLSKNLVGY